MPTADRCSCAAAFGTGASAGAAVGRIAFDLATAERMSAGGNPVILVRPDTSTADVGGFAVSAGIVTAVGGRTAHAALVARQMAKPCIVGCAELNFDVQATARGSRGPQSKRAIGFPSMARQGRFYLGRGQVVADRPEAELAEIERWRTKPLELVSRK